MQGGSKGVPEEEKRVHQMPGEPGCRTGEPEQGPHRRTQVAEGAVLPTEDGVTVLCCAGTVRVVP